MEWLSALFRDQTTVAHGLVVLGVVVSVGFALGNLRVLGVSLGVGGVLFSGLVFGHLHFTIDHSIMEFLREFGLVLFVYAMGLQVGPGFFSSLRQQGLSLNLMAATIVVCGTVCAVAISLLLNVDTATIVGLLSGAVTNTPSLGAAQQALGDLQGAAAAKESVGLGYALAYPFGIVGTILTMLLIRRAFRVDLEAEARQFDQTLRTGVRPLLTSNIEVTNPNLKGKTLEQLMDLVGAGVVVSRVLRDGTQKIASPELTVEEGDVLHVVGTEARIDDFRVVVGRVSTVKVPQLPSAIHVRKVVLTQSNQVGKTIDSLDLEERYGVVVTRVTRSGIEFSASGNTRTQYGDRLTVVGEANAIDRAAKELGDSLADLDKPHVLPIFLGIALGVIVGSYPIAIPHMPVAVKLGLAGGPLVVAIALGRLGKVGPLLVYVPTSAKMLMRELGIALFLACVGLKSGERFFHVLLSADGLTKVALGALITLIPLVAVAWWARWRHKLNFVSICGMLAGGMTDPPALAYASQMVRNDAPSVAYATVYPLTMFLRVVVAQLLVLLLR